MELTRRDMLRFGAAAGAGMMLPRFVTRGNRADRMRGAADPVLLYTYEEGVDATAIPVGNGVIAVAGQPMYSAADASHGTMGWLCSPPNGGGRLMYANPGPSGSSGSVYLVPRQVPAGSNVMVAGFWSDLVTTSPGAMLRLTADGRVDIADGKGTRMAATSAIWGPEQRVRLDWQQVWTNGNLTITGWVYLGGDGEGWRPRAIVSAAVSAVIPSYVSIGQEGGPASVGYDTLRLYNVAAQPAPYNPIMGAALLHTYDDGANNRPVLLGDDGIVNVQGAPQYSTKAAKHGSMGVLLPPTGGGILRYDNPYPPAHTGSLYVRVVARGKADSRVVAFQNGTTALAMLRVTGKGELSLADANGRVLAVSSSKAKIGRWTRIDWQQIWDGNSLAIDAKYFAIDCESFDNFSEVAATVPAPSTPDTIALGTTSAAWNFNLDTFRTWGDLSAWPGPFDPKVPALPPGMVTWAGDATQKTVEISAYTTATTSVGLTISTTGDMKSVVQTLPSTAPNEMGWNKWSVTNLLPGVRYFHQLTDTPVGGNPTPIGTVSAFKTLQPVGAGYTIKVAIGSCGQNNPTNNACFDDIVAWGADRTIHLGDFGYPVTLNKDPTTHMYNWARQATDAGFKKILANGCMDYIVSDHDDNGTGSSNLPTYNDPITMANIEAWQQVVPARMEDAEDPPHGRWRADVEGNVRFVKLDTRSIDKTDTTTLSTDPRSPDSTMLGATQLAWLKGQIDAAAAAHQLVIVCTDPSWNGTSPGPPIPASYADKWPSYIYERDLISDYAAAAGAQMFIAFGDTHGLQQDDGTSEKNGFAMICCGPFDQDLHMHYQDSYQWNYPDGIEEGGGPYRHGQQYQRLTITQQPGSAEITLTAEARDCSILVPGTPMTVRTLTKTYTP